MRSGEREALRVWRKVLGEMVGYETCGAVPWLVLRFFATGGSEASPDAPAVRDEDDSRGVRRNAVHRSAVSLAVRYAKSMVACW